MDHNSHRVIHTDRLNAHLERVANGHKLAEREARLIVADSDAYPDYTRQHAENEKGQ